MFHIADVSPELYGGTNVRYLLRDTKFRFHLTGSRFFGNTRPSSDWDFFTTHTDECEEWLKSIGFRCIHVSAYKDIQLVKLLRWTPPSPTDPMEPSPSVREPQIDIQMVRDAGLKERAQAYIFSNPTLLKFYLGMNNPYHRDMLWDLVYSAANGLLYEGALNTHGMEGGRPNKQNVQNILANFVEGGALVIPPSSRDPIPF